MYAVSANVTAFEKNAAGLVLSGIFTGATKPSDASTYAVGCKLINAESGFEFRNAGTVAVPSWVGVEQVITAGTDGTTAVSVFGAAGPKGAIRINDVWVTNLSSTASNITVENPASTVVCTIAKGTGAAGALTRATSLLNTSVNAGSNVVVDSSAAAGSPGATVYISYTPV